MYSPSHRQAGAPVITTQSTLRTATDLCNNVALAVLLDSNGDSYTVSTQSDIRIYTMFFTLYRTWSGRRNKNFRTAVNTACEGNLSGRLFGHASYRFVIPSIGTNSEHVLHKTGLLLTPIYRNFP
jgi:hypothetical protein